MEQHGGEDGAGGAEPLALPDMPTRVIAAPPGAGGPDDDSTSTGPGAKSAAVAAVPTMLLQSVSRAQAAQRSDAPTRRIEVSEPRPLPSARQDETGRVALPSRTAPMAASGDRRRARAALLWVASIAGGVGLGVAAYLLFVHRSGASAREDDDPPAAGEVRIELGSSPPGAKVLMGEDVVGTTPTHVDLPSSGKVVEFVFAKTGYESRTRRIKVNAPKTVRVDLVELTESDELETGGPEGSAPPATGAGSSASAAPHAAAAAAATATATATATASHSPVASAAAASPGAKAKKPPAKRPPKKKGKGATGGAK